MEQLIKMEFNEAVRKRPAMYTGSTSVRGFNNILSELVRDVFNSTETDYFEFELLGNLKGKFILKNINKTLSDNSALTFYKLNDETYQGFELAVLNALSKSFEFSVFDKNDTELFHQKFEKGELKKGEILNKSFDADKIEITFDLDDSIFEIPEPLNANFYLEQIRNLAYLHKEKTLSVVYSVDGKVSNSVFKFENGMQDKIDVEKLKGYCGTYFDTYIEETFKNFTFEVAFCFRETSVDESFLISYANYIHTHENGNHVNALLKGICQAAEKYALNKGLEDVEITSSEAILKTLVAAIHIKMDKPHFEGSVKNKLINPEIVLPITEYISEIVLQKMEDDQKSAESLLNCFRRFEWQNNR